MRSPSRVRRMIGGVGCLVMLGCPCLAEETGATPEAGAEIKRLQEIWQGWGDSVTSLDIQGHKFMGGFRIDPPGLSREEFRKVVLEGLVSKIKPGEMTVEELRAVTGTVFSNQAKRGGSEPTGNWATFSFVGDSGGGRVDALVRGRTYVTVRRDGQEQRYSEGTKQLSLHGSHTGLRVESKETFLYAPRLSDPEKYPWKLRSPVGAEPQHLECVSAKGLGVFLDYDGRTGFVRSYAMGLPQGRYHRERIQLHPVETPAGVPIPRIVVEPRYDSAPDGDGTMVQGVTIYVFERIEWNQPIDPERFRITVPKGTTIVHFDKQVPDSRGGTRPFIERAR